MSGPRRIALLGAECTGKTTLAIALAGQLPGLWLPERLREFCDEAGRTPRADEQAGLLAGQVERERQGLALATARGLGWVLSDSTPLATALYSAELFGDESLIAQAIEHQRGYALTLLADIDLPWEPDGIQRDGPQARAAFHSRLRRTLIAHAIAHVTVSGDHARHVATALAAVRHV